MAHIAYFYSLLVLAVLCSHAACDSEGTRSGTRRHRDRQHTEHRHVRLRLTIDDDDFEDQVTEVTRNYTLVLETKVTELEARLKNLETVVQDCGCGSGGRTTTTTDSDDTTVSTTPGHGDLVTTLIFDEPTEPPTTVTEPTTTSTTTATTTTPATTTTQTPSTTKPIVLPCKDTRLRLSGKPVQAAIFNAAPNGRICVGNQQSPTPNANFLVFTKFANKTMHFLGTQAADGLLTDYTQYVDWWVSANQGLNREGGCSQLPDRLRGNLPGDRVLCSRDHPDKNVHLVNSNIHDAVVDNDGSITVMATDTETLWY